MAPQLDAPARRRAIDALAFAPGRAAAEAVHAASIGGPEDLRAYATWWLENRATNDWREYGLEPRSGGMAAATLAFETDVMKRGRELVDVDVAGASDLWLTVTDGGDGNSCDWAAIAAPRFLLASGEEVTLHDGAWVEARAGWGETRTDRDPSGGSLEFPGTPIPAGIGTHAPAEIRFRVPEGALRFVAEVGPEEGGVSQQLGASTQPRLPRSRPDATCAEAAAGVDGARPRRRRGRRGAPPRRRGPRGRREGRAAPHGRAREGAAGRGARGARGRAAPRLR